jgi:uncharacterized protein
MEGEKPISETEIDDLEQYLDSNALSEGALNISSLHGFLPALVSSPSLVPISRWAPVVWGREEPIFDSEEEAGHVVDLLARFYSSISEALENNPDEFLPLLYEEDFDGKPYLTARDWCEGFSHGVGLCAADWEPLVEDKEARALLTPIVAFTSADAMADVLQASGKKVNRESLIDFLPLSAVAIYEYWREERSKQARSFTADSSSVRGAPNLGRNDPCPCGSGKKYKKCCGAAQPRPTA